MKILSSPSKRFERLPTLFTNILTKSGTILLVIRDIYGSVYWITDPDPVLSTVAFEKPTKILSLFCLFLTVGTFTTLLKDQVVKKSQKQLKGGFLSVFWLVDGRIRIRTNNYGTDPYLGSPKNLRIWILNTACNHCQRYR